MSALQTGTARGREAAGTTDPEAPLSPVAWFTDAPPGDGPAPGTTWADAATAGFPFTRTDTDTETDAGTGIFEPAGPQACDADHADDVLDPAATVVHHGEIVPRQPTDPDDVPPVWPTIPSTAALGGEPTHTDKDA
jgi:hypothetical protein